MSEEDFDDRLRWLSPTEAVSRVGRITNIYREAFGHTDETAAHFSKVFSEAMMTYKGATCLVAEIDGEILGFVFGFDFVPENWWPRQIIPAMEAAGHHEWLDDAFELAEIEVDPEFHGQGLGSSLLHAQLDSMRQSRALLATHPDNPARGLYRRFGFVDLLEDFEYPETKQAVAIMGWER
ncbi:GNAT family N-acetyltransferase [Tessaracoccus sp. OS52]|uniref:GNAT family N-acetyltransferase n=1 Tax=Tessaracoccus sp. OS52 TaxID=2886691 RepID=UPI001D10B0A7|nr:GNAT family N-acetyltransferase [Tessaracoccus sp. OS52]MCC2592060.1 GNAT family N-acetyltransferase [Tessaracoccus sp. OS52]